MTRQDIGAGAADMSRVCRDDIPNVSPEQLISQALTLLAQAGALPEPLLTPREAAALVPIGVEAVRHWCRVSSLREVLHHPAVGAQGARPKDARIAWAPAGRFHVNTNGPHRILPAVHEGDQRCRWIRFQSTRFAPQQEAASRSGPLTAAEQADRNRCPSTR
jgi:hypothetical protein